MDEPWSEADIEAWRDVPPDRLATDPELLDLYREPRVAAARALKYARLGGPRPYDEIGFRSMAATVTKGYSPLQTFAQARADARRAASVKPPPYLAALLDQAPKLRPRPLALPDGRLRYTIDSRLFHLTVVPEDGESGDGVVWSYPLSAPPAYLLDTARDEDARVLFAHYQLGNLPPLAWFPLPALIGAGRFPRMQECRSELVSGVDRQLLLLRVAPLADTDRARPRR